MCLNGKFPDRHPSKPGSKVVPKNDVVLGLRSVALMASLSVEMKLLWHSISNKDSRGLVWQQGVTSSVFQDRHWYLVNADVFAEVIDFIISMSVKYYTIRVFSNAELSFCSSLQNHAVTDSVKTA